MFRVLDVLFAALFLFAASLQWNDPDPVRWVLIYTAAAAACVAALRRPRSWMLPGAVALVALGWAFALAARVVGQVELRSIFAEFKMTRSDPLQEEAREAVGLLLVAAWCAVLGVRAVRARRRAAPPSRPAQGVQVSR